MSVDLGCDHVGVTELADDEVGGGVEGAATCAEHPRNLGRADLLLHKV